MQIPFVKMHGCGNDYIYFDCMTKELANPNALAVRLSDRRFGIGGDGVILVCASEVADAKMRMFNQDGSEGAMCGNGVRCVGKFLADFGYVQGDTATVETKSGIKTLTLYQEHGEVTSVKVDMGQAELHPRRIPMDFHADRAVNVPISVGDKTVRVTCVSMGNPHCVVFCDDPYAVPLSHLGPQFEKHPIFPEQVNTEWVHVQDASTLQMRVWERGSGETWACGTGACASVVAAVENGFCEKDRDVQVLLRGGNLTVRYTDETVWMTGEAVRVFDGSIDL